MHLQLSLLEMKIHRVLYGIDLIQLFYYNLLLFKLNQDAYYDQLQFVLLLWISLELLNIMIYFKFNNYDLYSGITI